MAPKAKKPAVSPVAVPELAVAASFPPMSLESLADAGRENLAAMTKANLALSEGLGAIGEELLSYAKSALVTVSHTVTALLGAKTLDEVIELNSDLAKTAMEALIARTTKLSELGISTTNQALAPLGGRLEATLAMVARPAA